MRKRVGEVWIGLGLFHLVVVGIECRGLFAHMIQAGFAGSIAGSDKQLADFMLFTLGVPLVMVGMVLRWTQRRVGTVPQSVGWVGAVCFLAASLAIVNTGAWLVAMVCVYTIIVGRQGVKDRAAQPALRDVEVVPPLG